ncbi:MAG: Ribonuclease 3 [Candidatus Adlerbacteria bacterium GW2011_GWA1_54_10]|uniref:Ribonuclease 3 n=3 Tax=Candidatus Adleribacteriota TaxID=1752736 RepID=A0A1F4Y193_9BACT|nr:MAG: Ribonuclease 3 [Candidatus Adlerbacteria bacterium GW2011_GWA1_54_10]KKW38066.1 MAG: Ribonuclease 3 [Candidatus Adlerbacteria bacterium GW2011_GWB1_54_7]OGC87093.1 MAG: ribonuclease III [Candidatus Adlerbacteria bacterium RIFCSPLOWO2_01_FULL_54_16]
MPKDFKSFEQNIGIHFNDAELLRQAFTHRSYLNEHRGEVRGHNERLEFLGDAVLELIVTRFLYEKFPQKPEGELTAYRAALVNAVTLSEVAQSLGMNDFLLLSRGEAKDVGRARGVLLANAIEALVGAIYIDQGYDQARQFIENHLFPKLDEILQGRLWQDPKSALQERAQEAEGITPSYKVLSESGPDHAREFRVGVFLNSIKLAEGEGKSKQEAEAAAAKAALESRGW